MKTSLLKLSLIVFACTSLFADWTYAGNDPDLEVFISNNSTGNMFVGGEANIVFRIQSTGENVPATFPTGSVVFQLDLPADAIIGEVSSGSAGGFSGSVNCSTSLNTVTCVSVNNYTMTGTNSFQNVILIDTMPLSPGTFTVPGPKDFCMVDPGNVVAESNEDNNECPSTSVSVTTPPPVTDTRWMGVTMWDNVVRVYDHDLDQQVNAAPRNMTSGTDVHAINDIAVHPSSGLNYVFHRFYESVEHRLGTLDPATGITDIGGTGLTFHDSAFGNDGTLYAIGRDAVLYTIDLATGSPTALCTTPYGSTTFTHSALAWDGNTNELLQIADQKIETIDLMSLPGNPANPCPATQVDLQIQISSAAWTAFFHDGALLAADNFGGFFQLGRNGEVLRLGTLDMAMHSMIPDMDDLPFIEPSCLPDAWGITRTGNNRSGELWEVDLDDQSLVFVGTMDSIIDGIDYDSRSDRLVTLRSGRINQWGVCTGNRLSNQNISLPLFGLNGLDIGGNGNAYAADGPNGELYELSPSTGNLVMVPGSIDPFNALAIDGDDVVVDETTAPGSTAARAGASASTVAIKRYSLASWPGIVSTDPLTYDPGIGVNDYRRILSFDAHPINGELLTIVLRVFYTESVNTNDALPNVLAIIDEFENVTGIINVPASMDQAIWSSGSFVRSGFENRE